jgi:hypothetical protein
MKMVFILFFGVCCLSLAIEPVGEDVLENTLSTIVALGYGPCQSNSELTDRNYVCKNTLQVEGSLKSQGDVSFLNRVGISFSQSSKGLIPRENAAKFAMLLLKAAKHSLGLSCEGSDLRADKNVKLICRSNIKTDGVKTWALSYTALDRFPRREFVFEMDPMTISRK